MKQVPPRVWQWLAREPGVALAVAFLAIVALAAILAPWVTPYDPQRIIDPVSLRSQPPSMSHLMGTDPYSRDLFSRMLSGARVSLSLAVSAVALATIVGTVVGLCSGYAGGVIDRVLMRLVDVGLSIPRVLLLLTVAGLWGAPSLPALAVILALSGWMGLSRLVRGEVRALRQHERIEAAHALGVSDLGILRAHVLPHMAPVIAVSATGALGQMLLLETGLSYLGLGVSVPMASWGSVLLDVSDVVGPSRWLAIGPGVVLVLTVAAIHRLGDAMERAGTPRIRQL